ncbi:MAG: pyridoxamine 5'-phosphate oxidase family protein [Proteobacteria bacterium]|nr:pyridoxamine 5'-phosphate oxidase family protein [Pseudomonadota bacterium]
MNSYTATPRTRVRRLPKRAVYDKAQVHAILDEGVVCHMGFSHQNLPYVIPTLYGRVGDTLYMHGSGASRTLKTMAEGIDVCVTVTLLDAYVLARSAFHHSMNYRSVVVLGRARPVREEGPKLAALQAITDHIVPGRWDEVRGPNALEMKQTLVLELPLTEVSAKVRTGPPVDDEEDYALPVWAGIVPVHSTVTQSIPDERLLAGAPQFDVRRLARRARATP